MYYDRRGEISRVAVFSGDRVNWDYGDRFVSKNTEQTPVSFPEISFQFLQARDRWELETSVNDGWFKKITLLIFALSPMDACANIRLYFIFEKFVFFYFVVVESLEWNNADD